MIINKVLIDFPMMTFITNTSIRNKENCNSYRKHINNKNVSNKNNNINSFPSPEVSNNACFHL